MDLNRDELMNKRIWQETKLEKYLKAQWNILISIVMDEWNQLSEETEYREH